MGPAAPVFAAAADSTCVDLLYAHGQCRIRSQLLYILSTRTNLGRRRTVCRHRSIPQLFEFHPVLLLLVCLLMVMSEAQGL